MDQTLSIEDIEVLLNALDAFESQPGAEFCTKTAMMALFIPGNCAQRDKFEQDARAESAAVDAKVRQRKEQCVFLRCKLLNLKKSLEEQRSVKNHIN